jgi:hypothetical protein
MGWAMGKWRELEQMVSEFVDQLIDLAAWKMITSSSDAIIGEKSNIPMRGMNCRIGARTGSVMS